MKKNCFNDPRSEESDSLLSLPKHSNQMMYLTIIIFKEWGGHEMVHMITSHSWRGEDYQQ